ncbi:recombinase family protein [Pseudomonas viridiflava]|nr:recombinase family protein [Pseudomonas viridiflava]
MKGDSQRRQIEKIRHYAVSNGYQLNETLDLQDLGLSAYHAEHMEADAGLGRFLLAIESGLIPLDGTSYLCIEQLDRLSRQSIDQANELFKKFFAQTSISSR